MKRSFLLLSVVASAAGYGQALAGETCYGFSGQTDNSSFRVGDTVEARHLKVHVRSYQRNGTVLTPDPASQFVRVQSTQLAGSEAAEKSELYIYNSVMQIVPKSAVSRISLRVAENRGTPSAGRHSNIELNGTLHEVAGSLRDLHDRQFTSGGATVRLDVKLASNGPTSDWFPGALRVRAVSGQIESFGIGSTPMVVDDVCLTPNAP